ncbi:MAG: acyltransferase [Methanobrevibacter sp.]|uniref:acyltransferase family protein n=1 Tax=Methanobrevibacter sp. TaxID=66852 RepID=UPI0025E8EEC9|nr:acyltransferase [Methanobrevibacter sp.]MBR0271194.1 acyltransferase [Methanobrevibacter sp.]
MAYFNNKKDNNNIIYSLNFLKFLAVFGVICIHCSIFPTVQYKGLVIDALARFSVPAFFLISGFFSYYDDNSIALHKYKTRMVKLIKLFIIANIVYFLFEFYTVYFGNLTALILEKFTLYDIFYYFTYDVSPFGTHLWFIFALIYCYLLFYILTKFCVKPKILYKFIPILIAATLFMSEFCKLIGMTFPLEYYRNFLFMGLPFFTIGYYIHDNESNLNKLSNTSAIILAFSGILLTILEVSFVGMSEIFVGTVIFITFVFIWCVKNPNRLYFRITDFIGGKLFTSMYILHVLVIMILAETIQTPSFIACSVLTVLISTLIYLINTKLNIKF